LAILIAGLGVFGLVSHATERRTKEIAVRKVLGASSGRIVRLLSREYVVLAIPACLVAWPAAWFFMTKWLQSFAFRTPIRLWVFVFSGLATAAVALATAGLKSARAARLNPAERLRFE
jgi:putative ABC transport system permease protein